MSAFASRLQLLDLGRFRKFENANSRTSEREKKEIKRKSFRFFYFQEQRKGATEAKHIPRWKRFAFLFAVPGKRDEQFSEEFFSRERNNAN